MSNTVNKPSNAREIERRIGILRAYLNGAAIQVLHYRSQNSHMRDTWLDCSEPVQFRWDTSEYRVKPPEPPKVVEELKNCKCKCESCQKNNEAPKPIAEVMWSTAKVPPVRLSDTLPSMVKGIASAYAAGFRSRFNIIEARNVPIGRNFYYNGKLWKRCDPQGFLTNSRLITELKERGDIIAMKMSDGKLTAWRGDAMVETHRPS